MATDFKKLQQKRKFIRLLKKLGALLVLVALAVTLYATRDRWFAKLEGIGSRHGGQSGVAGESFPLTISGGIDYQSALLDGCFALLGDTTLKLYGTDGSLMDTRQHTYTNATLRASGKRLLIYDMGGSQLRLESRNKTIFENTVEGKIIFAELGSGGHTAVVTTSDRYVCMLTVFDSDGKNIYSRGSVDRIISLCFTDGGKGCCTASIYADSGRMHTKLDHFTFSADSENVSSVPLDTFGVSAYNSNNGIFVLGDTECGFYNEQCVAMNTEQFGSALSRYAFGDAGCAVVLSNSDTRRESLILWSNPEKEPLMVSTDFVCIDISVYGDCVYMLGTENISVYDFDGTLRAHTELDDSFDEIVPCADGVIIRGYDRVELIDIPVKK